jgi:hypothetical protein
MHIKYVTNVEFRFFIACNYFPLAVLNWPPYFMDRVNLFNCKLGRPKSPEASSHIGLASEMISFLCSPSSNATFCAAVKMHKSCHRGR